MSRIEMIGFHEAEGKLKEIYDGLLDQRGKLAATLVVASAMLLMQKGFFKYPGGKAYLFPPEGNNETYGKPPKWLETDEWFNL